MLYKNNYIKMICPWAKKHYRRNQDHTVLSSSTSTLQIMSKKDWTRSQCSVLYMSNIKLTHETSHKQL